MFHRWVKLGHLVIHSPSMLAVETWEPALPSLSWLKKEKFFTEQGDLAKKMSGAINVYPCFLPLHVNPPKIAIRELYAQVSVLPAVPLSGCAVCPKAFFFPPSC